MKMTQQARITVAIVADEVSRGRLRAVVLAAGAQVAGEIGEVTGLRLLSALAPDLVLLDGGAVGINPLAALPALRALPGAPPVVYLTATSEAAEESLARALGATVVVPAGNLVVVARVLRQGHNSQALSEPEPQHLLAAA